MMTFLSDGVKRMKSKYHSKKITVNGITYASRKEYRRHSELLLLEKAGAITDLQTQVKFVLIPAQYETIPTGEFYKIGAKKGQPKTKKKCVEQPVTYYADFVYTENGKKVVEDAKGFRTEKYIIKKKLMLWVHGIRIKEV
jgi:hypothetical protein